MKKNYFFKHLIIPLLLLLGLLSYDVNGQTTILCRNFGVIAGADDAGWNNDNGSIQAVGIGGGGSPSYRLGGGQNAESNVFDFSPYSRVALQFIYRTTAFDAGEQVRIQFNDGSGWADVATYTLTTDFTNGTTASASVTVNAAGYTFDGDESFRIRNRANGGTEYLYIDDVCIYGYVEPEIEVTAVADGGTDATYGATVDLVSGSVTRTYTIQNTLGTANLVITSIASSSPGEYTVDTSLTNFNVAVGATTTFAVTFNPTAIGVRTATINILSNDSDEATYNFTVTGTCVDREINLQGGAPLTNIASGDVTPTVAKGTDFGSTDVALGTVVKTFTIQNLGTTVLGLTGGTRVAVTGDFSVVLQPAATVPVAPGALTFQITFNPTATGIRNGTVTIVNDDFDESTYTFAVTGNGTNREINIQGGAPLTSIASGDVAPTVAKGSDFGSANVSSGTVVQTFTIQNTGTTALGLTGGVPLVTVTGDFSVSTQPSAATIAGPGSLIFQITFDPTTAGTRNGTVTILNDDFNESTYTFAVTGIGTDREINLQGGAPLTNIASGDVTPSVAKGTDFGSTDLTVGTVVRTFTIENTGTTTLGLTGGVSRVAVTAGDFTVTTQPSAATIAGPGSLTFQITFDPTVLGVRNATVTILNDDFDEPTYTFAITGTGAALPEINVRGNGVSIVNNDITPSLADHTDFGTLDTGSGATLERLFTVENLGAANLDLAPSILGGSGDFTVTTFLTSPVTPAGTVILGITFNPSSVGLKSATVTIPNNDSDENPYFFHIQGTGALLPEISVTGKGVLIADGTVITRDADDTDFDAVNTTAGSVTKTFTIFNTGSAILNLTGGTPVTVVGANAADFTVVQPSPTTVASGGSVTFDVTFNPSANGFRNATINIANDDFDEGPIYNFNVIGEGTVSAPNVVQLNCPQTFPNTSIPGTNTIVNTYHQSVAGTLAVGADSITIGASTGATDPIVRGDLLLIIQMQNGTYNNTIGTDYGDGTVAGGGPLAFSGYLTSEAGKYEYVVALSDVPTTGGVLSITPTVNSYVNAEASTAGSIDTGRSRYQIIRVPRYNNLTIAAGASITTSPWDGEKGGIVVLDVNGTLNMSTTGKINANNLGFRGGVGKQLSACGGACAGYNTISRSLSTMKANGGKAEGIVGTPRYVYTNASVEVDNITIYGVGYEGYPSGSFSRGAPGNAGGGGNDADTAGNSQNSGGGGGGNGSTGGMGGNTWSSNSAIGGFGGAKPVFVTTTSTDRLILGGGGGAGARNDAGPSSGSCGGGIVILKVGAVSNAGTITANGQDAGATTNDGGGGAGAGGTVFISATTTASLAALNVSAVGGTGGTAWALQAAGGFPGNRHGPGGGGGGGVVFANGALASMNVNPGLAGTTTTSGDTYGSTGLGTGVTVGVSTAVAPVLVYPTQASTCGDIAIQIESNNLNAAIGNTVTFKIYVTNNKSTPVTGLSVQALLPSGYSFVSSSAGGAYNSATGVNTIGALAGGAQTSFTVVATVVGPAAGKEYMLTASLHRLDQMDFNPINNQDSTGLPSLWLKANAGTNTIVNGAAVTTWNDQSLFANHATSGVSPSFKTISLNFNPAIAFNGSTNRMAAAAAKLGFSSATNFAVIKPTATLNYLSGAQTIIGANLTGVATDCSGFGVGDVSTGALVAVNDVFGYLRGAPLDVNHVFSGPRNTTVSLVKEILVMRKNPTLQFGSEGMRNGVTITSTVLGSAIYAGEWTDIAYRLGYSADVAGTGSFSRYYSGDMNEIISYPRRLSTLDTQKINTYLALKYGITMAVNYVDAARNTVYNVSSYPNRIFGFGKDTGTSLDQRQAQSEDDVTLNGTALVVIGNNKLISTENVNATSVTNNGSYFICGDNNGAVSSWGTTGIGNYPANFLRLACVWKATESGTIPEEVRVRATGSRLPAIPAGKVVVMITANDPFNFSSSSYTGTTNKLVPMSKVGSDWECFHNFTSGTSYYTFAITDGCYDDVICIDGTTTWTGAAWSNGLPTINKSVVIAGAYSTANPAPQGNFSCCSLTVNLTRVLTIHDGGIVTTQSSITNNGSIVIANNGSLMQYADITNNTGTGTLSLTRTSQPMYAGDYTYWSSPVSGFNISGITKNRAYRNNSLYPSANQRWELFNTGVMESGRGYIVMTNNNSLVTPTTTSVTFSGTMHNGNVSRILEITGNTHNLLGNPYPSALEADDFIMDNTNIAGSLYFWTHYTRIDQTNDPSVTTTGLRGKFSQNDYAIYTLVGGTRTAPLCGGGVVTNCYNAFGPDSKVTPNTDANGNVISFGTANTLAPTGKIAAGQAFFVKGLVNASTVVFKNCQRTTLSSQNSLFYKTANKQDEKNRFWVDVLNEEGAYKQILLGYFDGATIGLDRIYDATAFNGDNKVALYTIIDDNEGVEQKMSIQGRPMPFEVNDEIKLGFRSSEGSGRKNKIVVSKFEGLFDGAEIYLEDKLTKTIHNIKKGAYEFESDFGEYNDRFVIKYQAKPSAVTDELADVSNGVSVSSDNSKITVQSKSAQFKIESVVVYDVLGKTIYSANNVKAKTFDITSVTPNQSVLIVVTTLSNGEQVTSKIVY